MEYAAKVIRDEGGGKHSATPTPLSKAIIITKICTYVSYFYRGEKSDDLMHCLVDKDLKLPCSFRLVIMCYLKESMNSTAPNLHRRMPSISVKLLGQLKEILSQPSETKTSLRRRRKLNTEQPARPASDHRS